MSDLLKINNLIVSFENPNGELTAVKGVSFSLKAGETLALVGESGCGKTVLCKSMLKILCDKGRIRQGEILLDEENLVPLSEAEMQVKRGGDIAMIFQDPMTSLDPAFSVGEQIAEVLRLHKNLPAADAKAQAIEIMRLVQIPDAESRYNQRPYQFSGGMRQRIVIAIALAAEPKLLLADEPTTALDEETQEEILKLLKEIQQKTGVAVLFITHDLSIVEDIADRVAIMKDGLIVECGEVSEVFANPEHEYTKKLLGYLDYKKNRGHNHRGRRRETANVKAEQNRENENNGKPGNSEIFALGNDEKNGTANAVKSEISRTYDLRSDIDNAVADTEKSGNPEMFALGNDDRNRNENIRKPEPPEVFALQNNGSVNTSENIEKAGLTEAASLLCRKYRFRYFHNINKSYILKYVAKPLLFHNMPDGVIDCAERISEPADSVGFSDVMISVRNLNVSFRIGRKLTNHVLRDFCMDIHRGEIVGLVGKSGCGKSTLARCIMGLEKYDGVVEVRDGVKIQMIFQDTGVAFNDRMTVGEIIAEPLVIGQGSVYKKSGRLLRRKRMWSRGSGSSEYGTVCAGERTEDAGLLYMKNYTVCPETDCDNANGVMDLTNYSAVTRCSENVQKHVEKYTEDSNPVVMKNHIQSPETDCNNANGSMDLTNDSAAAKCSENVKMRVEAAMRAVELDVSLLSRRPYELSGGQRQRVAIARALITEPDVIIADEPLTGLDVSTQAQIVHLLKKMSEENNLAILFIAHDLPMVNHISDRVIRLA